MSAHVSLTLFAATVAFFVIRLSPIVNPLLHFLAAGRSVAHGELQAITILCRPWSKGKRSLGVLDGAFLRVLVQLCRLRIVLGVEGVWSTTMLS